MYYRTSCNVYNVHVGEPKHAIECLRRALHYSPNSVRDVGYVGLANVFHRHGYMSEAVIAARAGLDLVTESVRHVYKITLLLTYCIE